MINKKFTTKKYGTVEVIDVGNKYGYYKVKFLKSGTIDEFRKDAIIKGEIRDKYVCSYLDIGIIGNIKTRGKNKKYYTIWRNMLNRCYNKNLPSANSYFGRVFVCEKWLTFEKFMEDICLVDGWDKDLFDNGKIVLDKDKKQRFKNEKIYSLETCAWISSEENNKYQDFQQNQFKAINKLGEIFYDYNITDFAKQHNLSRRQISAVLHGRYKTTQGWKFEFLDNDIV